MARVLIAVDDAAVREKLLKACAENESIDVLGDVSLAADVLQIAEKYSFHGVSWEKHLGTLFLGRGLGDSDGQDILRQIVLRFPRLEVIIVVNLEEGEERWDALRSGASAFYSSDFDAPKVISRIGCHSGERCLWCTEVEVKVLEMLSTGMSNSEIGIALGVSARTVKRHVTSMMRKMAVGSSGDMIRVARRHGWITDSRDSA